MKLLIDTVAKTIEALDEAKLTELSEFIGKHDDAQEYSIVPTEVTDLECIEGERLSIGDGNTSIRFEIQGTELKAVLDRSTTDEEKPKYVPNSIRPDFTSKAEEKLYKNIKPEPAKDIEG